MTVLLVVLALVIAVGVTFFLMKSGKIEDKDNNNIPDVIEEKIEKVKKVVEDVQLRVERVKEESLDVIKAVKEVGKQIKDVPKAAGKVETRRGRKPKQK